MAQPLFTAGRKSGFARFRVRAPQLILLAVIVVVGLRLTVNPTPIHRVVDDAIIQGGAGGADGLEDSYEAEPVLTPTKTTTTAAGGSGGVGGAGDGDGDGDADADAGVGGGGVEAGDGDGDGDNGADDADAAAVASTTKTTSAKVSSSSSSSGGDAAAAGKFSIKETLMRRRMDRFGKLTYGYGGDGGDNGKPEDSAVVIAQNNVKMPDGVVAYTNELGNNAHFRLDPPLFDRLSSRDWVGLALYALFCSKKTS